VRSPLKDPWLGRISNHSSTMWRDTQNLCYENHNGIADLSESVAELRRGHEGKTILLLPTLTESALN
jgi:hypothetical protein